MRRVLEKQRILWGEEEAQLQDLLSSKDARERQLRRLEAELGEFQKGLQRLAQGGLEPSVKGKTAGTEDELVARWRLYSVSSVWPSRGVVRGADLGWLLGCDMGCDRVTPSLSTLAWLSWSLGSEFPEWCLTG